MFLNLALAQRIENDLRVGNQQLMETWKRLDPEASVASLAMGDVLAIYAGPNSPVNEAVGLGMGGPVEAATLDAVEKFYREVDCPVLIRACALANPSVLALTSERGYVLTSMQYRWILDLRTWTSTFAVVDPRVRAATDEEEMLWSRTVSAGFQDVDAGLDDEDLSLERAFFHMPSTIPVMATEAGRAAAGGVLALQEGMAALFATSTLPAYRGRGLQTAMLDWRLRYAQAHGAEIATIETDPGSASQRNVERMGFRLAYAACSLRKD